MQANRTVQLALTENGKVYVKGSDRSATGILGLGDDIQESREFRQITAFQNKKIKQISLGLNHAAAIDDSDNLYIWGSGSNGQLAKINSSSESVKELSFSIPSKVDMEDMINNTKEVVCNHTSTTILTREYTPSNSSNNSDDKGGELKQLWKKSYSSKDKQKAQQQQEQQQQGSPPLNGRKKQKNQIQYSWQTFVKVITQGEWGGCALTKKGDIVFFNKFFQTEKLGGKSQFKDVFANNEKMFALSDESLMEWDFGFILKNGFFQNNKRTNLDRKLDIKSYPPKVHDFTQNVKNSKFILSQNNSQVALQVETEGADEIFVEKNNIFSLNTRSRKNSDQSNKLNSSYALNASQNRLNLNYSLFQNNVPRGLQSPTSFLGSSGEYKHNFFSPDSSDVYQKFLSGGNNSHIATVPSAQKYGGGYLGQQQQQQGSGQKSFLNFGVGSYRNQNANNNDHFYKQGISNQDYERKINQEVRRMNQQGGNGYSNQMQNNLDRSTDYLGKKVNTDESYMFEESQLPHRLKTLTDLHTQIGSHFRERVHEVQSTINKAAYNKRHGISPLKDKESTIKPSKSYQRIEAYNKSKPSTLEIDEQQRIKRGDKQLMTAGEFDQKWKELTKKSKSRGRPQPAVYKSNKDLNYFLRLIQSGRYEYGDGEYDYDNRHQSTPPKGSRDNSYINNYRQGQNNNQQRSFSQERNNWSPLTVNHHRKLQEQRVNFLKEWERAGGDKYQQENVLRQNNSFINNFMSFNNQHYEPDTSIMGGEEPQNGTLFSKNRANPFYRNLQQQMHANDKLDIFGGLGEGSRYKIHNNNYGNNNNYLNYNNYISNRGPSSHHQRHGSNSLSHSISGLGGSQMNLGSQGTIGSRNKLQQFQFIDSNGMKIKANQPKSKNNLNESVLSGKSNNRILSDSMHAGSERKLRLMEKSDFEKKWEALDKSRDQARNELNKSQRQRSQNNSFYSDSKNNRSRSNSPIGSQKNLNEKLNSSTLSNPSKYKKPVPSSFLGGLVDPTVRGQGYFDGLKTVNTEGLESNSVFLGNNKKEYKRQNHGLPRYSPKLGSSDKKALNSSREYSPLPVNNQFKLIGNNTNSPEFSRHKHQQINPEGVNDSTQNNQKFSPHDNDNPGKSSKHHHKDQKGREIHKDEKKDTELTEGSMNFSHSENSDEQYELNVDPSSLSPEELSKRQRREERNRQQYNDASQKQSRKSLHEDLDNENEQVEEGEENIEFNQPNQKSQQSLRMNKPGSKQSSHSSIGGKQSQSQIPQNEKQGKSRKIKKIVGYDKAGKPILEAIDEEEENLKRSNKKGKSGQSGQDPDQAIEKIVGYDEDGTPIVEESSGKIVQKVIGTDEDGKPIVIDVLEEDDDVKRSQRKRQPGYENVIQKVVGLDEQGRPIIEEIVIDKNGNIKDVNTRGFLSQKDIEKPEEEAQAIEKVVGFDENGEPIVEEVVGKIVKKIVGYDGDGKAIVVDVLEEPEEEDDKKKKSKNLRKSTDAAEPSSKPENTFQQVVGYDEDGRPIVEEMFVDADGVVKSVKEAEEADFQEKAAPSNTSGTGKVIEMVVGVDKNGKPKIEKANAKIVEQVVGYDNNGNPIMEEVLEQDSDNVKRTKNVPIKKIVGYDSNGEPIIEETVGRVVSKVVGYDNKGRPIIEEIFVDEDDVKRSNKNNQNPAHPNDDEEVRVVQKVVGYDKQGNPIIEKVILQDNEEQKPVIKNMQKIVGYDENGNPKIKKTKAQITKQIVGYDQDGNPIIEDILEDEEDVKKRKSPGGAAGNGETFQKVVGYDKKGNPIVEQAQGKIVQKIVGYDKSGRPVVEEIFVENQDLNKNNARKEIQKVVGYDKEGRPIIEKEAIPQENQIEKVVGYDKNGNPIVKTSQAQIVEQVVGYDKSGNPIIEKVLVEEDQQENRPSGNKSGTDQLSQPIQIEKVVGYDKDGKPIVEVSVGQIVQRVAGFDEKGRPIIEDIFVDSNDLKQTNNDAPRIIQKIVGYDKEGRPLVEKVVANEAEEEKPKIQRLQKVIGYDESGEPIVKNAKAQIVKQVVGYDSLGNPIVEEVLQDEEQLKRRKPGFSNGETFEKITGYDQNGKPIVEVAQGQIVQKIAGYDENGRPIIEEIFVDNKDLQQKELGVAAQQDQGRVIQKVVGYDKNGRPIIEKTVVFEPQSQYEPIQKVIGVDKQGNPIVQTVNGRITKQLVGYDSEGKPIIEEILEDEEDLQRKQQGKTTIKKVVGYGKGNIPLIEEVEGRILQKVVGYDKNGRPIVESIIVEEDDLKRGKNKRKPVEIQNGQKGRFVDKVDYYDENGLPVVVREFIPEEQNQTSVVHSMEKIVGLDNEGNPIVVQGKATIQKQQVGFDNNGNPVYKDVLVDEGKQKQTQQPTQIQKIVGFDKKGQPIVEKVQGQIIQQVVGYDDDGRPIVEEILIDEDDLKRSKSLKQSNDQKPGRYVQKVIDYDEKGRPIIEKVFVEDKPEAQTDKKMERVNEVVIGVDSQGEPIIQKGPAVITKQLVGYNQEGEPIYEEIIEDSDQVKRRAQQGLKPTSEVQTFQKIIGVDKNGQPIIEESIAKIVQKVVGYDDDGRPIVETILIEEGDLSNQQNNNLDDSSIRIVQKVLGFDEKGRPIVEKIVVDNTNSNKQGQIVAKEVNQKIIQDQNGAPMVVSSKGGKITKQIIGYDDTGSPIIVEVLEENCTSEEAKKPQLMEKIVAYDKNNKPIVEQCVGRIIQQVTGYDKNGRPIVEDILIDEEDLQKFDQKLRGSMTPSNDGRIVQKVVGYDDDNRPIIQRVFVENDSKKKSQFNKSVDSKQPGKISAYEFLQQDEEEIANDFHNKREKEMQNQQLKQNNSLNKSQPHDDNEDFLANQLQKEIGDLNSRHSDLKKSQNLTYSSIDNLTQSPERIRANKSGLEQQLLQSRQKEEELLLEKQREEQEQQELERQQQAEYEQYQKMQLLKKQQQYEQQQQSINRLTPQNKNNSLRASQDIKNNSLRASQDIKNNSLRASQDLKNKSNNNLDMSRGSLNNSRSNTPSNKSGGLRFSDICNNFNNQLKKVHHQEQTKGFERNTGLRQSQYADQNRSRSNMNNSRGSMNNSGVLGSKSPVNLKKSMFSPISTRGGGLTQREQESILPDEFKSQQYNIMRKSQESINKSFNEVNDPNFIKSPISPIMPPTNAQQSQKGHFFNQAAQIAGTSTSSANKQGYMSPNVIPPTSDPQLNFDSQDQQFLDFNNQQKLNNSQLNMPSPYLSPISSNANAGKKSFSAVRQSNDNLQQNQPQNIDTRTSQQGSQFEQSPTLQQKQSSQSSQSGQPQQQVTRLSSELSPASKPPTGQGAKQQYFPSKNSQQNLRDSQTRQSQSPVQRLDSNQSKSNESVNIKQTTSQITPTTESISNQRQPAQNLSQKSSQEDLRQTDSQIEQPSNYYYPQKSQKSADNKNQQIKAATSLQGSSGFVSEEKSPSTSMQRQPNQQLPKVSVTQPIEEQNVREKSPLERQQSSGSATKSSNIRQKQDSIKDKESSSPSSQMKLSGTYSLKSGSQGEIAAQRQSNVRGSSSDHDNVEEDQDQVAQTKTITNPFTYKQSLQIVPPGFVQEKRQSFGYAETHSNEGNLSNRRGHDNQHSPMFSTVGEKQMDFNQNDKINSNDDTQEEKDQIKRQKRTPTHSSNKLQEENQEKESSKPITSSYANEKKAAQNLRKPSQNEDDKQFNNQIEQNEQNEQDREDNVEEVEDIVQFVNQQTSKRRDEQTKQQAQQLEDDGLPIQKRGRSRENLENQSQPTTKKPSVSPQNAQRASVSPSNTQQLSGNLRNSQTSSVSAPQTQLEKKNSSRSKSPVAQTTQQQGKQQLSKQNSKSNEISQFSNPSRDEIQQYEDDDELTGERQEDNVEVIQTTSNNPRQAKNREEITKETSKPLSQQKSQEIGLKQEKESGNISRSKSPVSDKREVSPIQKKASREEEPSQQKSNIRGQQAQESDDDQIKKQQKRGRDNQEKANTNVSRSKSPSANKDEVSPIQRKPSSSPYSREQQQRPQTQAQKSAETFETKQVRQYQSQGSRAESSSGNEDNQQVNKGFETQERETIKEKEVINTNKEDSKWKLAEKKPEGKQSFEAYKKQLSSQGSLKSPQNVASPANLSSNQQKSFEQVLNKQPSSTSQRDESPIGQKITGAQQITREKSKEFTPSGNNKTQGAQSIRDNKANQANNNSNTNNTQENQLIEQNTKLEQEGLVISDIINTQDQLDTNRNISARQLATSQSRTNTSPIQRPTATSIYQQQDTQQSDAPLSHNQNKDASPTYQTSSHNDSKDQGGENSPKFNKQPQQKEQQKERQRSVSPSLNTNQNPIVQSRLDSKQKSNENTGSKYTEKLPGVQSQVQQKRDLSPAAQQQQQQQNQQKIKGKQSPGTQQKQLQETFEVQPEEADQQQQEQQQQQQYQQNPQIKGKYTPKSSRSQSPSTVSNKNNLESSNNAQEQAPLTLEDLQDSGNDQTKKNRKQDQQRQTVSPTAQVQKGQQNEIYRSDQQLGNTDIGQQEILLTQESPSFVQVDNKNKSQNQGRTLSPKKVGHIYEEDQQGDYNEQSEDVSSDNNKSSPLIKKNRELLKNNSNNALVNKAQSRDDSNNNQREQSLSPQRNNQFQKQQSNLSQSNNPGLASDQGGKWNNQNPSSLNPSLSAISPRQTTHSNISPRVTQQQSNKNIPNTRNSLHSNKGDKSNFSPRMSQENFREQIDSSFEELTDILNEKREQVQQQEQQKQQEKRNRIGSSVSSTHNISQINPTGTQVGSNTQIAPVVSPRTQYQGSQDFNIYSQLQQQQQEIQSPLKQQESLFPQLQHNHRNSRGNSQTNLPLNPPEIQDEKYKVLRESALGSIVQKKEERDNQVLNLVKNSGYSSPNPSFHQTVQQEEQKQIQQMAQAYYNKLGQEDNEDSELPANLIGSVSSPQSIYSAGLLKQNTGSPQRKQSYNNQQSNVLPQQILSESEMIISGGGNMSNYSQQNVENLSSSLAGQQNNPNSSLAKEIMRRSNNLRDQEKLVHKDKDKFLDKRSRSGSKNHNSQNQQNQQLFSPPAGFGSTIIDERSQVSGTPLVGSQSMPFNDNSSINVSNNNQDNPILSQFKNSQQSSNQQQQYAQHPLQQAVSNLGNQVHSRQQSRDSLVAITQSGNLQTVNKQHSRHSSQTPVYAADNRQQQQFNSDGEDISSNPNQNEEDIDPTNIYQAYRKQNPRSSSNIGSNISPQHYVEHANMNQMIQEQQYMEKVQTISEEQSRLQQMKHENSLRKSGTNSPFRTNQKNQAFSQNESIQSANKEQSQFISTNPFISTYEEQGQQGNQMYQKELIQSQNYEDQDQHLHQQHDQGHTTDEDYEKEYATLEEAQQAMIKSEQKRKERQEKRQTKQQQQPQTQQQQRQNNQPTSFIANYEERVGAKQGHESYNEHEEWLRKQENIEKKVYEEQQLKKSSSQNANQPINNNQKSVQQQLFEKQDEELNDKLQQQAQDYLEDTYGDQPNLNVQKTSNQNQRPVNDGQNNRKQQFESVERPSGSQNVSHLLSSDQKSPSYQISSSNPRNNSNSEITFQNSNPENSAQKDDKDIQSATFAVSSGNKNQSNFTSQDRPQKSSYNKSPNNQEEVIPTFGDYENTSRSNSRKNSLKSPVDEFRTNEREERPKEAFNRDFNRKSAEEEENNGPTQFSPSEKPQNQPSSKQYIKIKQSQEQIFMNKIDNNNFVYLNEDNSIRKSPAGSIYKIIEQQKKDIQEQEELKQSQQSQQQQPQQASNKPTLLPPQHGQKLSFQDYKNNQSNPGNNNTLQSKQQPPTFNQMSNSEFEQNSSKDQPLIASGASSKNFITSLRTSQYGQEGDSHFNIPPQQQQLLKQKLQQEQQQYPSEFQEEEQPDQEYDLDVFRVRPSNQSQNLNQKNQQSNQKSTHSRESFGNIQQGQETDDVPLQLPSNDLIMQNFNDNIAQQLSNRHYNPTSNSSRGRTINQVYEESSENHNTSYFSQHLHKTEESEDDSIQNYSQFRPFYDKNQGDESSAININYTPDKQNLSRNMPSQNVIQTSYYQSPSMNLSRTLNNMNKVISLDPQTVQGNRLQFEQLIASQRAQTDRNLAHSQQFIQQQQEEKYDSGSKSQRDLRSNQSFGDHQKQKSRGQVIADLYQKEVKQIQQNVVSQIQDRGDEFRGSFSKNKSMTDSNSGNFNPFLKQQQEQQQNFLLVQQAEKQKHLMDMSFFKKMSSDKQVCVVLSMKIEKFLLKRKFQAFQHMAIYTQMASKRQSFSNIQFREKQQIAKLIATTLINNVKKIKTDFFIKLRLNMIHSKMSKSQQLANNKSPSQATSQQKINSQQNINNQELTRKQQLLFHSIHEFQKKLNKLKHKNMRYAFDQILYSDNSLRPTIDQNQFFIEQRSKNLIQQMQGGVLYTDNNDYGTPQTPERKTRQSKNNKALQRATSDSPERLAKIQQQVRNSQSGVNSNSLKQQLQMQQQQQHNNDEQLYNQQDYYGNNQDFQQEHNQSFSDNQVGSAAFGGNSSYNPHSQKSVQPPQQSNFMNPQLQNLSKKGSDSQLSIPQVYFMNDNRGYKLQMNEFESNLESPHERNTEDNDYRPQYAPAYADPKEFQPDIYVRNLSQDDLLLIEELQRNNPQSMNRPMNNSHHQFKHQSHGSRMDYSDFDQNSQQQEQDKQQFEKYLNQFNLSMSHNQSMSHHHTPLQQPLPNQNTRNSYSSKSNVHPQNFNIADYQLDDDNSFNHNDQQHQQYSHNMQYSYTMPTTEQMKQLNQSQQYAFIPENLQPGYLHKHANKLLKIPAIVNYDDIRQSMTNDKKMNEQSLINPPAQHLPGYDRVINAQKTAIAKTFKKLHNERVTGKEITINPNQTLMNSTSVLSPTQRGLSSSQSMYITNPLNSSSYQSPRSSLVAMNASNRLYGIAVQKQQKQQQQQQQQQQSTSQQPRQPQQQQLQQVQQTQQFNNSQYLSPTNKSQSLRRSQY